MKTTHRILLFLRVALHVLVAVLLAVGMGVAWGNWWAIALAVLFGAVYLAGTVAHRRGRRFSTIATTMWLAAICGLWLAMSLLDSTFVWLMFPLVFIALHLIPGPFGVIAAFGLWLATVFVTGPAYGVGGVLGPALGTVLAVVIYYSYQALQEEAEHYKELAARLTQTRFELAESQHEAGVLEERERMSREIHDTLAQGFSSILLLSRAAIKADEPSDALATIEETAQENLREARQLVTGQQAVQPLEVRVEQLATQARRRQEALGEPLDITCHIARGIAEPQASIAERVVREGLSNITRHAHATKAVITIDNTGDDITVDVFDNGRGIDSSPGFGLRGLRARIEEVGGTLAVESSSSGTVLAARIPGRNDD